MPELIDREVILIDHPGAVADVRQPVFKVDP
jgi:hypothetical protein